MVAIVTIEYARGGPERKPWTVWSFEQERDLRDRLEAAVASLLEIEQEGVDMRMRPYSDLDEWTSPIFIHVETDVDHDEPIYDLGLSLTLIVAAILKDTFGEPIPCARVWLRETNGNCHEIGR